MRRSSIILTTIISMVLCVSLLAFSVYAHLTQTFSVTNTIGFRPAEDVYVGLECRVSGAIQTNLSSAPGDYDSVEDYLYAIGAYKDVEFNESLRNDPNYSLGEWQILESLEFASVTEPIIYTIKVYNYSDKPIRVSINEYGTDSGNIVNSVSGPIEIGGYKYDENPSWKEITLSTMVKDYTASFSDIENNFVVMFETIDSIA